MYGITEYRGGRETQWRGEAAAQAAFAVTRYDGIDGKRNRVELCRFAALDHRCVQAFVLVHIELEQLGRSYRRTNFFDADRGERRYPEPCIKRLRGGGNRPLTLPMKHSLQRGRGEHQRHGNALTHDRHAHVYFGYTGEHIGHQIAVVERRCVAILRPLVIRCTVNVVENRRGQARLGQCPKIRNIVAIG